MAIQKEDIMVPSPEVSGSWRDTTREETRELELVPIDRLVLGPSPRTSGTDSDHVRLLAEAGDDLPPILVDKRTLMVIDGAHRLEAARLKCLSHIAVRFFDGTPDESFIAAVRANVTHGKPLTFEERRAAVLRILVMRPELSDNMLGTIVGLSPRTIAKLRRNSSVALAAGTRLGLDGKRHPAVPADVRSKVERAVARNPMSSSRSIAREVGVSVGTVSRVRNSGRNEHEERAASRDKGDALCLGSSRGESVIAFREVVNTPKQQALEVDKFPLTPVSSQELASDRAFASTSFGEWFVAWFEAHDLAENDCERVVKGVPLSRIFIVANMARQRAAAWTLLARALECRSSGSGRDD